MKARISLADFPESSSAQKPKRFFRNSLISHRESCRWAGQTLAVIATTQILMMKGRSSYEGTRLGIVFINTMFADASSARNGHHLPHSVERLAADVPGLYPSDSPTTSRAGNGAPRHI